MDNESEVRDEGRGNTITEGQREVAEGVIQLASAYLSQNSLQLSDIPSLLGALNTGVRSLYGVPEAVIATANADDAAAVAPVAAENRVPAVPIDQSVKPDYLICLNDGKHFKSLKRHLKASYNLSPEQYRAYWGLPGDYPMVAPAYSEARSKLAKNMRLGQRGTEARSEQKETKTARKGGNTKARQPATTTGGFSLDAPKFKKGDLKIADTLTGNGIICMIDGEETKNLGRHLKSIGVNPEEYRAAYGLDDDYPMTVQEIK